MRRALKIGLICLMTALLMPVTSSAVLAACSNPTGAEGDIVFNETHNVAQYCDDVNWIAMRAGDPSPDCPDGIASCGGREDERLVFVSMLSSSNSGSTGGVSGMDSTCQTRADAAGLSGTYLAWIADNDPLSAPYYRFEKSSVPYVRVDGQVVADDWADLTDGDLDRAISYFADGTQSALDVVVSNVATDGTQLGSTNADSCTNWTSTSGTGNRGRRNVASSSWTDFASAGCGSGGNRAYCFEQKSNLTQVVPDGLVGHWRMDETSGITALDSSGNNNNGIVSDTTFAASSTSGMVGKAFNSLDDNDRIAVPDSATLNPNTAITVSAWVRSRKESRQRLVTKWGGTDNGYMLWIEGSSGPRFEINTAAGNRISFGGTTIANDDVWHHLVGVYDGSTVSIYLDGVLDGSAGHSGLLVDDDADLYLSGGSGGTYIGGIDDVRIYDRALTEPEITEIYEARNGIRYNETANVPEFFNGNKFVPMAQFNDVTSGLVGHWKLDETTGTTAADSSGNGNDATMQNGMDAADDSMLGAVGSALSFDGVDDRLGAGSILNNGETEASVCTWAKLDTNVINTDMRVLSNSAPNGWIFQIDEAGSGVDDTINFTVETGNASAVVISPDSFALTLYNNWTHLCGVFRGGEYVRLYANGAQIAENTSSIVASVEVSGAPLWMGTDSSGARPLQGAIDDVRIYNRALTEAEIQSLYAMGAPVGSSTALPQGCPNVGDVCDDGTVYAGISPDGSVEMYTTSEDAGLMHWNNDNTNYTDVSGVAGSTNSGISNTLGLVVTDSDSVAAGFQTHFAAQYCHDFEFGGNDDWYLPAPNEMLVLYNNRVAIGNFDVSGEEYWTSEQGGSNSGRTIIFSNGALNGSDKHVDERVRCVRKGPAPRCSNPYGLEGSMFYNTTHDVMQYCDGARWVAIGKQD